VAIEGYTLEQAEAEIAELRGLIDVITEAHTKADATDAPVVPASGLISYSTGGQENYVSADGNTYYTGRATFPAGPSGFPYSLTTSMTTVPGLSAPLGVGAYRVHAQLLLAVPVTAGQGQLAFQLTASGGLTAGSGRYACVATNFQNGVGSSDYATLGSQVTGNTPGTAGANQIVRIDGYFVVTVAGTINVQAKQGATAAVTIPQYGTYLEIYPAVSS
jgi:hypothetical protein